MGTEAIELMEITFEDIDKAVKDVERDKLLPLRELEGLGTQIRTITGSLKVAIAKLIE